MTLRKINTLLVVVIVLVNGYVIAAPFWPALVYHWQDHQGKREQLTQVIHPKRYIPNPVPSTQPNHVVVPSMLLNQPIYEGAVAQQYKVLDKGIWRYPKGSTPDKGGNTVLIGHRFTYTNPRGVFYYLNKVAIGDEIGVFWNSKEYLYKVTTITVVDPHNTSIEDATSDARLTLFTCTPLWLPKDRLVVVAELETS